jgi:hypothetical protein
VECPDACDAAVQAATENAMDGSIDIYDIYEDVCLDKSNSGNGAKLSGEVVALLGERNNQLMKHSKYTQAKVAQRKTDQRRRLTTPISPIYDTCISNFNTEYLNLPEVQKAIHVKPGTIPHGKWSDCGNVNYTFNYDSELPNYQAWAAEGKLQILIYNGDADYILSHMGNAAWIREGLNLTISEAFRKWKGSDQQVAGYYERYGTAGKPLTFLTVKGAGHMVPKDRPRHGLDMFKAFLDDAEYDKVPVAMDVNPLCPA